MLQLQGVTKDFTVTGGGTLRALDGVDLHVERGELVTVLGPSGCGKTTLLRSIAGFEQPDGGMITIDGHAVVGPGMRPVPAHERGVGLVPQEGALFPHLTVAQNVAFGLTGRRRGDRRRRVAEVLELVGLADAARRRPHELSGGQQQRVALARALAPDPEVILLDEPFSSLDEYLRETLRLEVRDLLRRLGATAVLVTHDQEEALALGDRVVVMRHGRIAQVGSPHETYFRPADLELARFLGEAVVVDGRLAADSGAATVTCAFGSLPVACAAGVSNECAVLIRPENISVHPEGTPLGGSAAGASAGLVGTVDGHTFYGHDGLLSVSVPELGSAVPVRVMGDRPFAVGDRVRLTVERAVCTYPRQHA